MPARPHILLLLTYLCAVGFGLRLENLVPRPIETRVEAHFFGSDASDCFR